MAEPTPQADLSQLRIERGAWEDGPAPRRRRRGLMLLACGLLALLLALAAWGLGWLSPAHQVRLTTVSRLSPALSLTSLGATGYVVAQRKAAVSSKGTGRLAYMGIEAGTRVKAGQVMARLENEDLAAARDEAKARLAAAQAQVAQAQAEAKDAAANFARFKALLARQVAARADFEVAETRLLKAQAALESARRGVEVAQASLRTTEATLDYTFIRAPFDAMVLTKDADVGEVVAPFGSAANAKAAVATLADMESLMVEADVTEANIGKVSVGQPCLVALDAWPDNPQLGRVHVIMPSADRSKGTIIVKVRFDQRDPAVLPEMAAKVSFLSRPLAEGERLPRLSVLKEALFQEGGQSWAWRAAEGRISRVQVRGGPELGETVQVLSGLADGDKVVLAPQAGLREGDKVKVASE